MIQRIQTIHLVLSVVLGLLAVVLNFCACSESLMVSAFGVPFEAMRYAYIAFICLAAIVAGWSIFLFQTRLRQIKMVSISTILYLLSCITLGICYLVTKSCASWACVAPFLPVVAVIFNLMAQRRIRYDENLVRSADRLR